MPTTASSELTEGRSGAELDDDQPALPLELIAAWVEDQADPYAAPRSFREEVLKAMKERAPEKYKDAIQRFYEELIK